MQQKSEENRPPKISDTFILHNNNAKAIKKLDNLSFYFKNQFIDSLETI